MGKIFLNKYHFSFNQDSKTINLHLKHINNDGKINTNNIDKNKYESKININ